MDILKEFELCYSETKQTVDDVRNAINTFVEQTVYEKSMDERAKSRVEELWESGRELKQDVNNTDDQYIDLHFAQAPDIDPTALQLPGAHERLLAIKEEIKLLFSGSEIGESNQIHIGSKPEPKLINKPKKRTVFRPLKAEEEQERDGGAQAQRRPVQPASFDGGGEVSPTRRAARLHEGAAGLRVH